MVFGERHVCIVGAVELSVARVLGPRPPEVPLFHTVVRERLEVGQELVGEQFRSVREEGEVSHPEHAHGVSVGASTLSLLVPCPDGQTRQHVRLLLVRVTCNSQGVVNFLCEGVSYWCVTWQRVRNATVTPGRA